MNLIEKFKNQHIVIKILDIAFVVSFAYEAVTLKNIQITLWIACILVLVECFKGFLKKES